MGVYIKGMDMPKDCTECMLNYLDKFGYPHCCITSLLISYGKTNGDCPLTGVPEPHGRLIDEDNLIVATKAFLPWSFETEAERGQYFQLDLFKTIIEETSTVIERSE